MIQEITAPNFYHKPPVLLIKRAHAWVLTFKLLRVKGKTQQFFFFWMLSAFLFNSRKMLFAHCRLTNGQPTVITFLGSFNTFSPQQLQLLYPVRWRKDVNLKHISDTAPFLQLLCIQLLPIGAGHPMDGLEMGQVS